MVKKVEAEIHAAQKLVGADPYDFDDWWNKKIKEGASTVKISKGDEPPQKPVPQGNYTLEEAIEIIGENDCAILTDCAKHAEAEEVFLGHELNKLNPDNQNNYARRGMVGNRAMKKFEIKKGKKE